MAKTKLTPEMKRFIEKNVNLSNRFLSERITENHKIKVSHVIVGRYKKSFLETSVETPLEIVETQKPLTNPDLKRAKKIMYKIMRARAIPKDELEVLMDLIEKYIQ